MRFNVRTITYRCHGDPVHSNQILWLHLTDGNNLNQSHSLSTFLISLIKCASKEVRSYVLTISSLWLTLCLTIKVLGPQELIVDRVIHTKSSLVFQSQIIYQCWAPKVRRTMSNLSFQIYDKKEILKMFIRCNGTCDYWLIFWRSEFITLTFNLRHEIIICNELVNHLSKSIFNATTKKFDDENWIASSKHVTRQCMAMNKWSELI